MVGGKKSSRSKDTVTREYTINLHKRLHDTNFKKRAPLAVKQIRKFAQKAMGTKDVRLDVKLNKVVWSRVSCRQHVNGLSSLYQPHRKAAGQEADAVGKSSCSGRRCDCQPAAGSAVQQPGQWQAAMRLYEGGQQQAHMQRRCRQYANES